MVQAPRQGAGSWSPAQVHDTVATILREPVFAARGRESLLGRLLRFVIAHIRDWINRYRGSANARYIVIAALIVLILIIIARIVSIHDAEVQARRRGFASRASSSDADQWSEAQRLAAAGDYTAAGHALYAGLLARVARSGGVTLHASKTGGDYSRELYRRGLPIAPDFRSFSRRFDRVMFGTGSATAQDFAELTSLAERVLDTRHAA
jgi:Domain of unknown function (DUF4129)